jgi:hypothetical protein
METRGRQLFYNYIDIIRKSKNYELKQETFCVQYFMRKIDDIYAALNSPGMLEMLRGNISVNIMFIERHIQHSMIYSLIFFMYSLFEIIDKDFKNNPVKKIRNKLGHGKNHMPLNNFTKFPEEAFLKYEFNDLMGCNFTRGSHNENIISLVWHFKKNDNKMISMVDDVEYESPCNARDYLIKKLNKDTLYIDSTGNFACNIDNLYNLSCKKVEEYLKEKFDDTSTISV